MWPPVARRRDRLRRGHDQLQSVSAAAEALIKQSGTLDKEVENFPAGVRAARPQRAKPQQKKRAAGFGLPFSRVVVAPNAIFSEF